MYLTYHPKRNFHMFLSKSWNKINCGNSKMKKSTKKTLKESATTFSLSHTSLSLSNIVWGDLVLAKWYITFCYPPPCLLDVECWKYSKLFIKHLIKYWDMYKQYCSIVFVCDKHQLQFHVSLLYLHLVFILSFPSLHHNSINTTPYIPCHPPPSFSIALSLQPSFLCSKNGR